MERLMAQKKIKDSELEIYNEAQRWWVNIKDNCTATISQFEDSIKLQKEIEKLADSKIKELDTK